MKLALTVILVVGLVACVAAVLIYGTLRWRVKTGDLRARLTTARLPAAPATYSQQELANLPLPVQRYFRAVLPDGQPMITAVRLSQQGQFRLKESEDSWRPFSATQWVTTRRPGFDWDARIRMAPGLNVFVRDAYAGGKGILHAALFGLFTVAKQGNTPEMAQGELMRYLAECPWYPTALLPSHGVHWEAMDDSTARATLADGDIRVSIEFHFDREGLITRARAPARYREVAGTLQPTPWEGRFRAYARRHGMRIPLEAEVAWHLPDGPLPYWRARIIELDYDLVQ